MDWRVYISDLKRVYICISDVKETSLALGNPFPLKLSIKPAPTVSLALGVLGTCLFLD